MSDLFSWAGFIFLAYLGGGIGIAAFLPEVMQEEDIELPVEGVALLAAMVFAWPAVLLWVTVEDMLQRKGEE